MPDYDALMGLFSTPRPSGSTAERQVLRGVQGWLDSAGISWRLQTFRLYPHFWTGIGAWLILSRTLLALAVWLHWGWPAALLAFAGLLGGLVDVAFNFPLVTWPGATRGENLLLEFAPPQPRQEVLISAHSDTKTELLDHRQRMIFVLNLRTGILLTIALGIIGPLEKALLQAGSSWAAPLWWCGVLLSLPMLFLAWGLGLHLILGRLCAPSQGAVDNGAACAILLGLAESLQQGEILLQHTRLTLVIFGGEEVNMQGSQAYVRSRDWLLPARALNLEIMAQDGDYVLWEQDGLSLKLWPCSLQVNQAAETAVLQATGQPARLAGPLNSDGGSFLRAGIPASTLGTYDTRLVDQGFHSTQDNLGRVVMERLPQGVEILKNFLKICDAQ
jgi:hypothetical protein